MTGKIDKTRCTLPPAPVHESFRRYFPRDCLFLRCVEVRTSRGKRIKRVLAINPSLIVLSEGESNVNKIIRFPSLQKIVIQRHSVSRMFVKKSDEVQVLFKCTSPPDVLCYFVDDARNMEKSDVKDLADVVTHVASNVYNHHVDVEVVEAPGELSEQAHLKKPPGYVPPKEHINEIEKRVGSLTPDELASYLGRKTADSAQESPEEEGRLGDTIPTMTPGMQATEAPANLQQQGYLGVAAPLHQHEPPSTGTPSLQPARASLRPPPPGTPGVLYVVSPTHSDVAGDYHYVPGEEWGGMPMWDHPDGPRFYSGTEGHWIIGTAEVMHNDGAWMRSVEKHGGKMPHELQGGWMVFNGSRWELIPSTHVTDNPLTREGLVLQGRASHWIERLSVIANDLRRLKEDPQYPSSQVLADLVTKVEAIEAASAQNQLLRPKPAGVPFSNVEVQDLQRLNERLEAQEMELLDRVQAVKQNLHDSFAASSMASTPRNLSVARARGMTGVAAGGEEVVDELQWAGTLQAAQFLASGAGDTTLLFTARARVVTSNGQVLSPCGLALTNRALYLCTPVDGKILHRQPAEEVEVLHFFTDRRVVGIVLPSMEFFVQLDLEAPFVRAMGTVTKKEITRTKLQDYVTNPDIRQLLELDPKVVEELQQELEAAKMEAERWKGLLQQERTQLQQELDDVKTAAAQRLKDKERAHQVELQRAQEGADHMRLEVAEMLRRQQRHDEAMGEKWELLHTLCRAVSGEGERWSAWAQSMVAEERLQLVLACTATVEKTGRSAVECSESDERSALVLSALHALKAASSTGVLTLTEGIRRKDIEVASEVHLSEVVRECGAWLGDRLAEEHVKLKLLRSEHAVAVKDLALLREKHTEAEEGRRDEGNKVATLLRANKVLQQALDSCRFLDIHRVRLDNAMLRENAERSNIEREAVVGWQSLAIAFLGSLLGAASEGCGVQFHLLTQVGRSLDIEAEGMMRGGAAARDDAAVRSLAMGCGRLSGLLPKVAAEQRQLWGSSKLIVDHLSRWFEQDTPTGPDGDLDEALGGPYPTHEGWMMVADNSSNTWRKRFFVFTHGELQYQVPSSPRVHVVLTVDGLCHVSSDATAATEAPGGRYGGHMWTAEVTTGACIRFSCANRSERQKWIGVLREAMEVHTRNTGRGAAGLRGPTRVRIPSSPNRSRSPGFSATPYSEAPRRSLSTDSMTRPLPQQPPNTFQVRRAPSRTPSPAYTVSSSPMITAPPRQTPPAAAPVPPDKRQSSPVRERATSMMDQRAAVLIDTSLL